MTPRPAPRTAARALALAVLCAAGVMVTWWFFVTTPVGQTLDSRSYDASVLGRAELAGHARTVLDVVSVPFLALAAAVAAGVALARGRWGTAVAVVALIGGVNLATQLLKEHLDRPDFGIAGPAANSLPSGHTTVAASVAAVAVLAVPPRARPLTILLGAGYTAATGVATMVGGWHRASDVVAAVLLVAAGTFLALALLARGGPGRPAAPPGPGTGAAGGAPGHGMVRGLLALVTVGGAGVAVLALVVTAAADGDLGRSQALLAYGGAVAGAVAVTAAVGLGLLAVLATPSPRPTRRVPVPGPAAPVRR
ncbi:phosphatase PAP2 family protein [Georgenia sp. TF02-10]|uniref:phosphatase PAP2 family protein n=1 Tax=Georgenia sp. TF02-10 TaxID=2917725 RepID=UPI001FA80880|nr:phosphatase PAP2 family protein [Georgenia sp. TF02-10]UNX55258.1 phosphatase PAP2 family protein [Georgenia sp. TF02-10]